MWFSLRISIRNAMHPQSKRTCTLAREVTKAKICFVPHAKGETNVPVVGSYLRLSTVAYEHAKKESEGVLFVQFDGYSGKWVELCYHILHISMRCNLLRHSDKWTEGKTVSVGSVYAQPN